jgi:hypothetical protein
MIALLDFCKIDPSNAISGGSLLSANRIRGPNAGTGISSGRSSTLTVVWWPPARHLTSSAREAEAPHVPERHRAAGLRLPGFAVVHAGVNTAASGAFQGG